VRVVLIAPRRPALRRRSAIASRCAKKLLASAAMNRQLAGGALLQNNDRDLREHQDRHQVKVTLWLCEQY